MAKRLFDICFSGTALVLLSPLLALIGILVKLTSKGPVLYKGPRVGLNGNVFLMYKFRTMEINADKKGGALVPRGDARVTGIGRSLRKHKLDELPQLINVFKGDMSLVGPRPEAEEYLRFYTDKEKDVFQVRPGITDWASLWNFDEGAFLAHVDDPERAYIEQILPTKIMLQLKYIKHHPFSVDLKILIWTLIKIARKDAMPKEISSWIEP